MKGILTKLDEVFPYFFRDCNELLSKYKSVFSRQSKLGAFWSNSIKDYTILTEEELDVFFYALGYSIKVCTYDIPAIQLSKFTDLLNCDDFAKSPKVWNYRYGKFFLDRLKEKKEVKNSTVEEVAIERRKKRNEIKEKKRIESVLVDDVVAYCEYLIELCFRMVDDEELSDLDKSKYYGELIDVIDSVLVRESITYKGITTNLADCEECLEWDMRYEEFLLKIFGNKLLYVLYDYYCSNPSQENYIRILAHVFYNTKLYGYSSNDRVFILGKRFWKKILTDTMEESPDEIKQNQTTMLEEINTYSAMDNIKEYLDYDEVSKYDADELSELVDAYISDLLIDSKGNSFIQRKVRELKECKSLRGFNNEIKASIKGEYDLTSINEDTFLIDSDVLDDYFAEERLSFKFSENHEYNFDIERYVDLITEDYSASPSIDGSTNRAIENIVGPLLDVLPRLEYCIEKYEAEATTNMPNVFFRSELNSEIYEEDTAYVLLKDESYEEMTGDTNVQAPEKMSHAKCLSIAREYLQKSIKGYLWDCLEDIQNTVKDYAHIYFNICMIGNIEKNARKQGFTKYLFSCTENVSKGKKVIYKKELWDRIDEEWEERRAASTARIGNDCKPILRIIRDMIHGMNDATSIEEAFTIEREACESIKFLQGKYSDDVVELLEEITETTALSIEKIFENSKLNQYGVMSISKGVVEEKTAALFSALEKGSSALITKEELNRIKEKVISFIYTGEILYNSFISNSKTIAGKDIDYGIISLEYYKAIEYLMNQLFYRPYCSLIENDNTINRDQRSRICKKNGKPKDQLEFGTIAKMLSSILNMSNYEAFLFEKGVSTSKLKDFAEKMSELSDERNQSAHPYQKTLNRAKKDRAYIYEDDKSLDINNTIKVRELLFSLKDLFWVEVNSNKKV